MEKFKHLGIVFTSDEKRIKEIDTRFATNLVLREFYRYVVTKRQLSTTTKFSGFKSVFLPVLTYDAEAWEMTKRKISQVQAAKVVFLQRVHDVTLCAEVRSCEILTPLNVGPLFQIERLSYVGSIMCPEYPKKDWQAKSCWQHPRQKTKTLS